MVAKSSLSVAACVAMFASFSNALGHIELVNQCDFDIFQRLTYGNGGDFESYTPANSNRGFYFAPGLSLKIGRSFAQVGGPPPNGPFQFEITHNVTQKLVYYDFSTLDGNPFEGNKRAIIPSIDSCQPITCPPGQRNPACNPGSYYPGNAPSYNPVWACSENAIMNVYICGGF